MITRAPLSWPDGWKRTRVRTPERYTVDFMVAWAGLADELRKMGAINPILTCNISLRSDGKPRAGSWDRPFEGDPGAAVFFTLRGAPMVLACDQWSTLRGNVRALHITIQAMRGMERAGATQLTERAYRGFAALPPGGNSPVVEREWWQVTLGVEPGASAEQIKQAYHRLSHEAHPDRGGSHEAMQSLNAAYEMATRSVAA